MNKRYVLSSVQSFAQLLIQYPVLMNIPAFTGLKDLVYQLKNGCNCTKSDLYNSYRGVFERAVNSMTGDGVKKIKSVLGVDQVCYYIRNKNGVLEQRCL